MPDKFATFSNDFTILTDLDPKTNPDTFIQYVQARLLEELLEQQSTKMNELIDAVKSHI